MPKPRTLLSGAQSALLSGASLSLLALLLSTPAHGQTPLRAQQQGRAAQPAAGAQKAAQRRAAPAAPGAAEAGDWSENPPGEKEPPPTTMDQISKAVDTPYRPKPGGHRVKFNLEDADLAELVNHIAGLTGRRFIYGPKVRQVKVTVVSPTPVTLNEAYEAFLSILEANGMTVVPHGQFLKIVDSGGVVTQATPVYSRGAPVPDTDRFITRLYRLKNVPANDVAQLLGKFKSKEGDISVYEPGQLLIMTDSGANIRRMVRLVEEVDVGGEDAQMWIEPIHYGASGELAKQLNELFELGGPGGAEGLMRVIAEEQTNSLIVVGTEDGYLRLLDLLRRIDIAPAAEGKIHVLPLQNAVAEELAATLTQMLSGQGAGQRGQQQGGQAAAAAGNAAGMFEGEVRVTADQATNSLVVTSSGRDYAQLRLVVEKLDQQRRQVFIEAVIMDVSIDRSTHLGLSYHGGAPANLGGDGESILLGGFEPLQSILPGPDQLQGLALGVRGPDLPGTQNTFPGLAGLSIPAFGVVLNALATSGDVNVLSTPHIIATDNTLAEINVGENIPLQENFGGMPPMGGMMPGMGGQQAGQGMAGMGMMGMGMMGMGFGAAPRQDVGTRIRFTPHINDKSQVRLELEQEISERGASTGAMGVVSITQRTAQTTIVVDDQQTVVIGGLMRESLAKNKRKIPVLGDLPLLGFLFRTSDTTTRKTNLLLILTPYVIRDQADLRKVFERKMQERQEFLDRYFVFSSDWEPPRDFARANGLVESIRQAYLDFEERLRLEEESARPSTREHVPGEPIALPTSVKGGGGGSAAPKPATKQQQQQKRRRPRRRPRRPRPQGDASPIRINPVARSVNVERTE